MKGEEKLQALRKEMQSRKYDAYIIPHDDLNQIFINQKANTSYKRKIIGNKEMI